MMGAPDGVAESVLDRVETWRIAGVCDAPIILTHFLNFL